MRLIGREFIKHGAQQMAKNTVVNPKFPGLEKLGTSFEMHEEWYSLKDFRDYLHMLLVQDAPAMQGIDYQRLAYPPLGPTMKEKAACSTPAWDIVRTYERICYSRVP